MSDLTKLKEVLDNQAERGIRRGDWDRCEYKVVGDNGDSGNHRLEIASLSIGFIFSPRGRFIGIYNWKE